MKKINLKSILKKTFKKKKKVLLKKKAKPIPKKSKIIKAKKKIGRPKLKQINKNPLKEKAKINLTKSKNAENLRLTKSQDQKPEIVKIKKQETTGFKNSPQRFEVNITNMKPIYGPDEAVRLRCVAYDADEKVKASKLPLYRVSEIVTQAHYRIRDAYSDEIIIPFDTVDNSTLMSTDSEGMYFDIYTNDFSMGRVYAIDVLFNRTNRDQIFLDAGGTFRIDP